MLRRLAIPVLGMALSLSAHADIVIGSYESGEIRVFADEANGDVAPIRIIAGAATGLGSAAGGAFDSGEGVLYVADFWGQAIRVFPAYGSGNLAPLRVLDSPQLGQMRTVALAPAHDELITTNSGCCLAIYNIGASGSDGALRKWAWRGGQGSLTELDYPGGFAYASARDEIMVSESDPGPAYTPKILVFDRDTGTSYYTGAPKRVIKGAQTGMGSWVGGVAVDDTNDRVYATSMTNNPDNTRTGRVLVFAADAAGDAAPLRVIEGAATQLSGGSGTLPMGVAIDPLRSRLIVSLTDDNDPANSALLVFALDASGNAAPLQVIRGAQTGLVSLALPIWMPADAIFDNGFD